MRIRHKGLRALHEKDDPALLSADLVSRLRRILVRLKMRLARAMPRPLVSGYTP